MIFLTVGTQFPFDRLVKAVDDLVGRGEVDDDVFAQIGASDYRPRHMDYADRLDKTRFDEMVHHASALIGHAGIGTITMALQQNKPLLVMPRMKHYGELVNDHQLGTARKFEELGHVLVAYSEEDLQRCLDRLSRFVPAPRVGEAGLVADRIAHFLDDLVSRG